MRTVPALILLVLLVPSLALATGAVQQLPYVASGAGVFVTGTSAHPGLDANAAGIVPVRFTAPIAFSKLGVMARDAETSRAGFGFCIELSGAVCDPNVCIGETAACKPLAFDGTTVSVSPSLPAGTAVDVFVYSVAIDHNRIPAAATIGVATVTYAS